MDFIFFNPLFEPETVGYLDRHAGIQTGAGLASLFAKAIPFLKNAVKSIFPAIKKAATSQTVKKIGKEVRDRAIEAGLDIAATAVKGGDVSQTASKNLQRAREELGEDLANFAEKRRSSRRRGRGASVNKEGGGEGDDFSPPKKKKKKKKKPGAPALTATKKGSGGKRGELFSRKGR